MKNALLGLAAGALITFSACNSDDTGTNPPTISADQAQVELRSMRDAANTDIVDMFETSGMTALFDLSDLILIDDPLSGRTGLTPNEQASLIKRVSKSNAQAFKRVFVPSNREPFTVNDEGGFDYQGNIGVYVWNPSLDEFELTAEQTEIIEMRFPTEGSTVNNASLKITDYAETATTDEFETYYQPTKLEANLSVDEVEVVNLAFAVSYTADGVPNQAAITLFLTPFTYSVTFNDANSTSSSGSASVSKNDETIYGVSATVTWADSDKEEANQVDGTITVREYSITGDVDVAGADNAGDGADINDFVNLSVLKGSEKIGDIVFETELDGDGFEEEVPYIVYSDGTKEKLEDVFEPLIDDIEDYLEELDEAV